MVKRISLAAILSCTMLGLTPSATNGGEPLHMQVSPLMSRAPAVVTVRVVVEAADDNRRLQVVAESPDFYRSSEIQLDGRNAAAVQVFQFRDLPTGAYGITGTLVGTHGLRATLSKLAKVEPGFGSSR